MDFLDTWTNESLDFLEMLIHESFTHKDTHKVSHFDKLSYSYSFFKCSGENVSYELEDNRNRFTVSFFFLFSFFILNLSL